MTERGHILETNFAHNGKSQIPLMTSTFLEKRQHMFKEQALAKLNMAATTTSKVMAQTKVTCYIHIHQT